jgi:RNA polymerase sigma factor (sigma-70 family)
MADPTPAPASAEANVADRRRADWMRAAQHGDRMAYEALLRDAIDLVRRVAYRAGVADDRVDDIVQETLLTVHRVRHTYDPERSFDAWLCAIARRRIVDAWRLDGRTRSREVHDPVWLESYPDGAETPEQGHERHVGTKALEHLAFGEEPAADAALATGRSANSMKVNLHRALKALRARLGQDGFP